MRLIHQFDNERDGKLFHRYLTLQKIECVTETAAEKGALLVWVTNENDIEAAEWALEDFLKNPRDPRFHTEEVEAIKAPPPPPKREKSKEIKFRRNRPTTSRGMGAITLLVLISCIVLYGWTELSNIVRVDRNAPSVVRSLQREPVKSLLQYDYPTRLHIRDLLTEKYGATWATNPSELPPTGKLLLVKYQQTQQWDGLYNQILLRNQLRAHEGIDLPWSEIPPLFERLQRGEIWRLFTPAFLHGGLFHIVFNLLWLLTLGVQMESRLGRQRYLLFILIAAAFSNTLQYLVGGYNFLGLSGVICAMIGFIWMRQKNAAWEGYQMQQNTFVFITVFVLGLAALQAFSFFSALANPGSAGGFGVANTAHVSGGVIGIILGRTNLFAWKR